jgi:hypothetical protein
MDEIHWVILAMGVVGALVFVALLLFSPASAGFGAGPLALAIAVFLLPSPLYFLVLGIVASALGVLTLFDALSRHLYAFFLLFLGVGSLVFWGVLITGMG